MRKFIIQFWAVIILFGVFSSGATACSPAYKKWHQNQSVKHAKDCSFTGGGRDDFLRGEPAHDLGDRRVYQIIIGFGTNETAIVTDCNTQKQIQVYGIWDEAYGPACESPYKVKRYLTPDGPIDLQFGEDILSLSKQIERLGYHTYSGVVFDDSRAKRRDYPDFYCGCKLYYPDSAGAKS